MAVTLADFVSFLGINQSDAKYPQLQDALDAAAEWVESVAGVRGGSPVLKVRAKRSILILPLTNVASVDEVLDPDGVAVTPSDVDEAAGLVWLPTWRAGAYTVTVTTDASDRVDEATRIIAKHLWDTRRGKVASGFGGGDAGDVQPFMGYAIPRRAVELLSGVAAPGFA